jgi:hypothetical protein
MASVMPAVQRDQRPGPASDGVTGQASVQPRWIHAPLGGLAFVAVFDVVSVGGGQHSPVGP